MTIRTRTIGLRLALQCIAIALIALPLAGQSSTPAGRPAPEFVGIERWLNSPPLTMQGLRGKVVLIDFWTFACSNCIHTLPEVARWHDAYADRGLVIVGVHTPETDFEQMSDQLDKAIARFRIRYPVAQDNAHATWKAWDNHYWPAFYLVDRRGCVAFTHFGEGETEAIEAAIRRLLDEPAVIP